MQNAAKKQKITDFGDFLFYTYLYLDITHLQ